MKKSIGAETIIYPTPVLVVGTYDAEGKWNNLAAAQGDESAKQARDASITPMSPEQIAEAQRLSREFTPKTQK